MALWSSVFIFSLARPLSCTLARAEAAEEAGRRRAVALLLERAVQVSTLPRLSSGGRLLILDGFVLLSHPGESASPYILMAHFPGFLELDKTESSVISWRMDLGAQHGALELRAAPSEAAGSATVELLRAA